jgi:hypothetical protein
MLMTITLTVVGFLGGAVWVITSKTDMTASEALDLVLRKLTGVK